MGAARLQQFRCGAVRVLWAGVVAGVVAFVGIFVLRADARHLFDELTTKALPLVLVSALSGTASLVLVGRNADRGARVLAMGRRRQHRGRLGCGAVAVHPLSLEVEDAAAPSGALLAAAIGAVPGFILLYVLDQRSLLPEEGVD